MATRRTQTVALLALVIVLAGVLWYELRAPAVAPTAASNEETVRSANAGQQGGQTGVPELKLPLLSDPRPAPVDTDRNPFQFKPKPPPPPPPAPPRPMTTPDEVKPLPPPGPPPLPPITVKFIGVLEQEGQGKTAILSEKGNVFYGKEGQIVDGRYMIVRIGVEAIEMAYPDGRGRTTIRLTGS
jgi:hypothetical protein